jgi:hypothetical protein
VAKAKKKAAGKPPKRQPKAVKPVEPPPEAPPKSKRLGWRKNRPPLPEPCKPPRDVRGDITPEGVQLLKRELLQLKRQCTPRCRVWLHEQPQNNFEPFAGTRAGRFSRCAVQQWLGDPYVVRIRQILAELAANDMGIDARLVFASYRRQVHVITLRDFFLRSETDKRKRGDFIPPEDWTDEMAAAVEEHGYDRNGRPYVKLVSPNTALSALTKLLGLDPAQRLELSGAGGGPIRTATGAGPVRDITDEEAMNAYLKLAGNTA